MDKIPFFKTTIGAEEKQAISDVIDSGWLVMGKKTKEFEEQFAAYVGAKHAVFVDSGTSALALAIKCVNPYHFQKQNGRKVVVPSLTFTSTAEVLAHEGLDICFADVDRKTFCMTDETVRAATVDNFNHDVLPVHLTGNKSTARAVVYDSAHRIEKDDMIGSYAVWCYSFYATKNISTVQGGMICTNDDDKATWLRAARDHGISKGTLERYTQKTPTYSIDFIGYRVKGDDLRAAIGIEQLKKLPWMTQRRNEIVARYNKNLGLSRTGNHLYPILVSNRERFFEAMESAGIQCSVHFLPLHLMPAYKGYNAHATFPTPRDNHLALGRNEKLPNTEYLGERLVSVPLFPEITDEQVDYVSEKIIETGLLLNE